MKLIGKLLLTAVAIVMIICGAACVIGGVGAELGQ